MGEVLRTAVGAAGRTLQTGRAAGGIVAVASTTAVVALVGNAVGLGVRAPWFLWALVAVPAAVVLAAGVVALAYATGLAADGDPIDAALDVAGVTATLLAIVAGVVVGALLLVAPALATVVLSVYAVPIVVTERTSPVDALARSGRLAIDDPHQAIPVAGLVVGGLLASVAAGAGVTRAVRGASGDPLALAAGGAIAGVGAAVVSTVLHHAYLAIDRQRAAR